MPELPAVPAEFARCGVVGAGTMGTGIAYVLARSGASVTVVETRSDQVERSRSSIAARVAKEQSRAPSELGSLADRVHYVGDLDVLPDALDLVVESVPEKLDLKQQVLREVERHHPSLLGSNTSGIAIAELATALANPGRLVGLHFFNPVWSTPLLEIVRPDVAADDLIQRARRLAEQLGKQAIVVADRPGFATTRLGVLLGLEAMRMLEDGVADADDLDRAMELGYRHPMGPLRLSDLIGLDVRLDIARHLARSYGERYAPPQILIDKVSRGELGRKSGQGFYSWP